MERPRIEPTPRRDPELGFQAYIHDLNKNKTKLDSEPYFGMWDTIELGGKTYEIVEQLGCGGRGAVFRIVDVDHLGMYQNGAHVDKEGRSISLAMKVSSVDKRLRNKDKLYSDAFTHRCLSTGEIIDVADLELMHDDVDQKLEDAYPDNPDAQKEFRLAVTALTSQDEQRRDRILHAFSEPDLVRRYLENEISAEETAHELVAKHWEREFVRGKTAFSRADKQKIEAQIVKLSFSTEADRAEQLRPIEESFGAADDTAANRKREQFTRLLGIVDRFLESADVLDSLDPARKGIIQKALMNKAPEQFVREAVRLELQETAGAGKIAPNPKASAVFYTEHIIESPTKEYLIIVQEDLTGMNVMREKQAEEEGRTLDDLELVQDMREFLQAENELNTQYLEPEERMRAMLGVVSQVRRLHKRGLVHRDIKPANIIIDPERPFDIRLLDFSLTERGDEPLHDYRVDHVAGSPGYMPLEVVQGKALAGGKYSEKADIYSLGMTLYHFFYGQDDIYMATSVEDIIDRIKMFGNILTPPNKIDLRIEELRGSGKGYEASMLQTLKRMMSKKPEDRPGAEEAFRHLYQAYKEMKKAAS
ncbi:MAG: protein kinase [Candidatus Kerfeldbacteria bacterium]